MYVLFQRQLMETYIKQKRATPGMVQASDLQLLRPMSGTTTTMSSSASMRVNSGRELHAYDGPMQFMMSPNDPDQLTTEPTTPIQTGTQLNFLLTETNRPLHFSSFICSRRFGRIDSTRHGG